MSCAHHPDLSSDSAVRTPQRYACEFLTLSTFQPTFESPDPTDPTGRIAPHPPASRPRQPPTPPLIIRWSLARVQAAPPWEGPANGAFATQPASAWASVPSRRTLYVPVGTASTSGPRPIVARLERQDDKPAGKRTERAGRRSAYRCSPATRLLASRASHGRLIPPLTGRAVSHGRPPAPPERAWRPISRQWLRPPRRLATSPVPHPAGGVAAREPGPALAHSSADRVSRHARRRHHQARGHWRPAGAGAPRSGAAARTCPHRSRRRGRELRRHDGAHRPLSGRAEGAVDRRL